MPGAAQAGLALPGSPGPGPALVYKWAARAAQCPGFLPLSIRNLNKLTLGHWVWAVE